MVSLSPAFTLHQSRGEREGEGRRRAENRKWPKGKRRKDLRGNIFLLTIVVITSIIVVSDGK